MSLMKLENSVANSDNENNPEACDPFYLHGSTLIPIWISNYLHYKVWDKITHVFLNFNGCTLYWAHYLSILGLKLIHLSNSGHSRAAGFKGNLCLPYATTLCGSDIKLNAYIRLSKYSRQRLTSLRVISYLACVDKKLWMLCDYTQVPKQTWQSKHIGKYNNNASPTT